MGMFCSSLPPQLLTVVCLIMLDVINFVFVLDVVCCDVCLGINNRACSLDQPICDSFWMDDSTTTLMTKPVYDSSCLVCRNVQKLTQQLNN